MATAKVFKSGNSQAVRLPKAFRVKSKEVEEVLRRFRTLKQGEAALSVITFGELVYGAEKSAQRAAALELLRELARVLPVMGLPERAAEAYGTMRAELERKGQMIGNNDLWIAAHAKAEGLTLVTNNERESPRCVGYRWRIGRIKERGREILCAGLRIRRSECGEKSVGLLGRNDGWVLAGKLCT